MSLAALRRVIGVALFTALPFLRTWSSHAIRFISAMWVAIPFYAFGGNTLAAHAPVGALVNMVLPACIYSVYEEVLHDLYGLRDLFLPSPLTSFEFRAGLSLGIFLTTVPSVAICLGILFVITKPSIVGAATTIAIVLLLWLVSETPELHAFNILNRSVIRFLG